MIAQRVMKSLNIGKCWRKGHIISYEILCPKFALVNAMFCQIIWDTAKAGCHLMVLHSFKIRIFICFSFPLLFLVSFTNKVCLYRFQGRFNICQPFFLGFLFLNQKLELSLLQVVHTLIYDLLPNPGKKNNRLILHRSFPVCMSLVAVFFLPCRNQGKILCHWTMRKH